MPDINLSWTPAPANANSIGQRAKAIARVNGSVPNMTAVFIPANNMGVAVNNAIFRTSNFNIAYRFMVENICSSGGPIANTNGIREGIVFACIPPTIKSGDTTNTTYTARILKGAYTQIDGINYPNSYSDIQAVEYSLYDAANTTLIQGPILVNTTIGTGTSESFEHTFSGLTGSTSYTPRFALLSTINGVVVRSDAVGYLGTKCVHPAITTTGVIRCVNYSVSNNSGSPINFGYTTCAGVVSTFSNLASGTSTYICALQNSITVPASVSFAEVGGCIDTIPCYNYTLDNPSIGNSGSYNYTDCGGVVQGPFTIAAQSSALVCAKQGTVVKLSGTVNITQTGYC